MTNLFYYLWSFIFGLLFGSFCNVVILRDKARKSILTGRSECMNCHHLLAWYDLIPVLSYLLLRGRCRYCKKSISVQYCIVEIIAGFLGMFATWYGYILRGNWWLTLGLFAVFCIYLALSVIDIKTMEVPVEYTVIAGVIGLTTMVFTKQINLASSIQGIIFGGGSIAAVLYGWKLLFKQDGMGVGDIWLAAAIGAVLGFPAIIVCLMIAIFLGAIIGSIALGLSRKALKTAIPFSVALFIFT